MESSQLTDLIMDNITRKNFARFLGVNPKFRLFKIYHPATINQKPIKIKACVFLLCGSKVCSNLYDVVLSFEVCDFIKYTKN